MIFSMFFGVTLAIFTIFAPNRASANESAQAQQLLLYFSSTCPSFGPWTRSALSQATQLVQTLEAIKNDSDCMSLSGSISQVNVLQDRLNQIEENNDEREVLSLRAQEQELLLQISSATEVDAAVLRAKLQSVQVELAGYYGYQNSSRSTAQNRKLGHSLELVVSSTNALLNQAVVNQRCFIKNPGVLSGIASLTGTVASAVTTSGASLGLSAGVQLLGSVVELFRKMGFEKKIRQVSRELVATAHQCALESLSNQYCAAEDALNIVNLKVKSLQTPPLDDALYRGLKVLQRDLPIFTEWLSSVEAGTDPNSQAAGERLAKAENRKTDVVTLRQKGVGLIADTAKLVKKDAPLSQRWPKVKSLVSELINLGLVIPPYCGGPCPSNPAAEILLPSFVPYYLIGYPDPSQAPDNNNNGILSWEQFDLNNPPKGHVIPSGVSADTENVYSQFIALITQALSIAQRELDLIKNPSPLLIFSLGFTPNAQKRSAIQSIDVLTSFLQEQVNGEQIDGGNKAIYEDTLVRLRAIGNDIRIAMGAQPPVDPSHPQTIQELMQDVYTKADLDHGIRLLDSQLKWAIKINLTKMITDNPNGSIDKDTASQLLVADDVIAEMLRDNQYMSLTDLARDIERSQGITQGILTSYADTKVFGSSIQETLVHYDALAKEGGEGNDGKNRRTQAELCFKLLSIPKWPISVDRNMCKGFQMKSVFQSGPVSEILSNSLMDEPYKRKRICAYRDFRRAAKIYENAIDHNNLFAEKNAGRSWFTVERFVSE